MTSQDLKSESGVAVAISPSTIINGILTNQVDNLQLEPAILKQKMDKGEDIFIVDVRTPEEYNAWKISYDKYRNPFLIPIDELFESFEKIPKNKEVVTVCSHGNRSLLAAKFLKQLGYDVRSVKGGMIGWSKVYDISVVTDIIHSPIKIWQVRRVSKGCMAYIIASKVDNNAVVIDPSCETNEAILEITYENALRITKVIDTHMHADHVSGLISLAKNISKSGAVSVNISSLERYEVSQKRDELENDNNDNNLTINKIQDNDKIYVGKNVELKAILTPGHTNGSMCFLLDNASDITSNISNDVKYLFSGDTIFVDGIGRPDLHNKAEEYTNNLYSTLKEKILKLPDETIILPAHYSMSFEHEKPILNTLGSIKKEVKFLSLSRDEFIRSVSNSIPVQPVNYKTIIEMNKNVTQCDNLQIQNLEAGPNSCGIHT